MKIAILGGGVAGLAAAIRLKSAGHEVDLYEKNSSVGGKLTLIKKDGFTWDGGPSFFTDPHSLLSVFSDAGYDPSHYFTYRDLDEACRYFYEDGIVLHGYDSVDKICEEFAGKFNESPEKTRAFFKLISRTYDTGGQQFINYPFSLRNLYKPQSLKTFLKMPKALLKGSMNDVHSHFFTNPRVIDFFNRFATYNGSNPYKAPALLSTLPVLEHRGGAYQPKGGMRSIINALEKCAIDAGVRIWTNSVVFPKIENKKCVGIDGAQTKKYDSVVTAGEIAEVYKHIDEHRFAAHTLRQHSASAYVLYIGLKQIPTINLYLHNIIFSTDYKKETNEMWEDNRPATEPTLYINNTSYFDKEHAPKGYQNWFVMANVPAGLNDSNLKEVRLNMINRLSTVFKTDIQKHIVTEYPSLTPRKIQDSFLSHTGSIYGLASNSWRGAFLRPPNKSAIEGLYHTGVTVHPGGGIPLALRSAKIVSEMISS